MLAVCTRVSMDASIDSDFFNISIYNKFLPSIPAESPNLASEPVSYSVVAL